jgi:molybdopterin converting factor subunit 1
VSITLLYFAALRDLAGTSQESLDLAEGELSVGALLSVLEQLKPALRGRLASVRVAVNEEFTELSTVLHGGETVALIPPVSGG